MFHVNRRFYRLVHCICLQNCKCAPENLDDASRGYLKDHLRWCWCLEQSGNVAYYKAIPSVPPHHHYHK